MGKLLAVVLRFGPLVAAFVLGLAAVTPAELKPVAEAIVSILSLFGVQAHAELLSNVGLAVNGILALIGVGRKIYSIVRSA
jgi:hypothetical protein